MSCNCCGNGNKTNGGGSSLRMQQGDTRPLFIYYYGNNDTAQMIKEGYSIIAGFYDYKGNLLFSRNLTSGMYLERERCYKIMLSREESMMMVGIVQLELTLTSKNIVDHANDIVLISSEPRKNNDLL